MHFADWALAISCYKCPKKVDIKSFKARSTRCMASGDMRKLQQLPCTDEEIFSQFVKVSCMRGMKLSGGSQLGAF